MKKIGFAGIFVCLTIFSLSSQSLYFDIGLGSGFASTTIDGEDFSDSMGSSVTETSVDMGFKLGYGPIAGKPLYIVAELSSLGHRFSDSSNYIQFNSYLIGPGIVYYPVPAFQIAASAGYSYVANDSDFGITFYDSKGGLAGNISAALDLGKKNHGCLLGVRYAVTLNTLETSEVEQKTSMVSAFIKYAYRQKLK